MMHFRINSITQKSLKMNWIRKITIPILFICLSFSAIGQNPSISDISPKNASAGSLISIQGTGLAGTSKVFFGAMEGELLSVSDQLVEAKIPFGATYDNVLLYDGTTRKYTSGQHAFLSFGGNQGITTADFETQIDLFSGNGLYDVRICDLDGDGKNDLIGANSKTNLATILRNLSTPGNLSFVKSTINIGAPALNSTTADLNGDGRKEIIFSEGNDGNRILIMINLSTPGNLQFTLSSITVSGASTKRVVAKDLDLDGRLDLVVSDQASNKIYLIRNTSTGGTFSYSPTITTLTVANASSTSGLDVEDLNGDGLPEIITNQFLTDGGGFYVATNQSSAGSFGFSAFNQFNSNGTFVNLKVGDFDGDNKPDLIGTLFLSSSAVAFRNTTANRGDQPSFGSAQTLSTDVRPWGLDFGDMDGDNQLDILVATIGSDKAVNILNNTGSGGVNVSKVSLDATYINRNIAAADMDGDSKPDIVFTSVDDESNSVPASYISIMRNNQCVIPTIIPEGPINVCSGNTVRLEAQEIDGVTFEWLKDGATVKTGSESFIELTDPTESGSYVVNLITEGGTCNEASLAVDVTITAAGALASSSITTNGPVCVGGNLELTATDVGATSYEWRGPQDFTASGLNVSVSNFNGNKAGRYYLDVYSGSCIIETISVVVDIISAPSFFISQSGAGTYCAGDAVSLNISPNDANFNYQWYLNGSAVSGATNATFNPTASGTYYVEASDQLNTFCPTITTESLEVSFLSQPNAQFNLPTEACANTTVDFVNSSTVGDASLATYSWNFGDGTTSTSENPSHSYNSEGTYDVTLTVGYNGFTNCSDQITQQISISGSLAVTIESSSNAICAGDTIQLSVLENYDNYSWSNGATTQSIAVSTQGTYSVTVTDVNGCRGLASITVNEYPEAVVEISTSETVVSPGDTVTITGTGLLNYTWGPDSVIYSSSNDVVQVILQESTTVFVKGENSNGCIGSASIDIIVEEDQIGDIIKPMKFFSPNNDAIAQFWEIEQIENYPSCMVEIYDQKGNKLFSAKPYQNDWEGTANGSNIPDGVYYYVIKCDGKGIVKSGSITLLR